MSTKRTISTWVLLFLLTGFFHASASDPVRPVAQLTTSSLQEVVIEYEVPTFHVVPVTEDGVVYEFLRISGYGKMQEPGKPAMPVVTTLVAVPFHAGSTLTWSADSFREEDGYHIHPALEPATDHVGDPEPVFGFDTLLYQTDAFYPSQVVEVTDTLVIRGMKVLVIQVRPVQFNPVSGQIRVHEGIRVEIGFQGGNATFEPFAQYNSDFYTSWLSRMVVNGAMLPEGVSNYSASLDPNYLIVTIDPFRSAADSIALWRQQMGFRTEVISQPTWTNQQAKQAVHQRYHSYMPKPDYLLILGDHDHVPAEMIPVSNTHFGTDLYMVCMYGSADHFPDMAKGRISVANTPEAMSVVQKIINYERYPTHDSLFYHQALHCAQFQDDDTSGFASRRFTHTSEEVRDYIMAQGYDVERVYQTHSYINPTNYNNTRYSNGEPIPFDLLRANGHLWNGDQHMIAQAINEGRFYVLHRNHGSVNGWGHPTFNTTSLNMLSNGNLLPVVLSINCNTGNFVHPECFAEKFLRLPNGGAVGVFASSYISYSGYNDALSVGAFDAIWNDPGLLPLFGSGGVTNPQLPSHPPILPMGHVLNHMMLRMVQTWNGTTGANRRQYRMFHYFGDPAMRMFTAYPAEIFAQVPDTVVLGTTHLPVTGCNAEGGVVTLLFRDTLRASGVVMNGDAILSFAPLYDAAYDAVVTITKNNHRPFIRRVVVVPQAPALHNHPCNPLPVAVNRYCDPTFSSFAGADASSTANTPCHIQPAPDVWFSFVVPPSGNAQVEVGEGLSNIGMAVYQSDCITPLSMACSDSVNSQGRMTINLNALTPGDTLLVRVWENGSPPPETFYVCVSEPDTFPVAELPYYTGFEDGLDSYWFLQSSHPNGRIRIDTLCDARSGIASLHMDVFPSGVYVQNEAWLRVNLRDQENVMLKFWWREYGDETHVEDGVFFSDDGGENFVKVVELQGSFEGWTQYLLSVDKMAALYGLNLTETFVIKFQQYDNWRMFCHNPHAGDGFAFDDIDVYVDSTSNLYATIPYFADFEDGFDPYWSLKSTHPLGRIVVTEAYPPHHDGFFLLMDVSSSNNYNFNSADLRLEIPSLQDLLLRFYWKSFQNEPHIENGIWLSDDGGASFVQVVQLLDSNQYWAEKTYNLEVLAAAHNLSLGANTVLRLAQYDNWPVRSDGFGFDDLELFYGQEPVIDLHPIAMRVEADTGIAPTHSFSIINHGTMPFQVDSVSYPEGFASLWTGSQLIQPGDTLVSSFLFLPDSVKEYTGYLYVHHNATRGLDSLRLEGLGMHRELIADIHALVFDSIPWYESDTIEFQLINAGNGAVATSALFVPPAFSLLTPQSQNFSVGQSRPVRIRFNPPMAGVYQGQLVIVSNANQINLPVIGYAVDPLSVEDLQDHNPFVVKPNPFSDYLLIEHTQGEQYEIRLTDMTGRLLVAKHAEGATQLDMTTYAAGVYILELRTKHPDGIQRFKLVKDR